MNERLVAFMYDLIAHHAPPMSIISVIEKAEYIEPDDAPPDPFEQSNIELLARELVARLEGND